MLLIQQYVLEYLEEDSNHQQKDLENILGVSRSMVTAYKRGDYNPGLEVAIRMYLTHGLVFHPFSKESIEYEINKAKETK